MNQPPRPTSTSDSAGNIECLSESCREAISEKKIRVLSLAQIDEVELAEDKTMKFTATLVTHPDFELPPYQGLVVPMKSTEVTEAEIDESLENLRDQAADFEDIKEDRGAQMDDFIVVDYRGTIDGKPVHEAFPKSGKPLSGNDDFWIRMTPDRKSTRHSSHGGISRMPSSA